MGNIGGVVLMGDVDGVLLELDHKGEGAELNLIVLIDEVDEPLLGFSPSFQSETALGGFGGCGGRGLQGELGGLARVTDFMFGLFVGGVNGLAVRRILFLMVALVSALGSDMCGRLSFSIFGFSWGAFRRRALSSFGQGRWGGGLLLVMAADLLPDVIVELMEACVLASDGIKVDLGEEFILGGKVFNVLFGEGDAVGELAFVQLLRLVEEVGEVLLDVSELLEVQLRRQGAQSVFELRHMKKSVF